MMKIHLKRVDGSVYCGVNNGSNYDEAGMRRSDSIKDVTCKRCWRRYTRQPINKKVVGP